MFRFLSLSLLWLAWVIPPAAAQTIVRPLPPVSATTIQRAPVVAPSALRPLPNRIAVAGPMELTIIDPGYAIMQEDGTRELSFAACVADKAGNPGTIQAMHYNLKTPGSAVMGGTQSGEMGPYFERKPPQIPGAFTMPQQQPKLIGQCRRATVKIPKCELPPGDYELIVMAEVEGVDGVIVTKGQATLAPNPSKVGFNQPDGFTIGAPGKVSGWVSGSCGVQPTKVQLYSDDGAEMVTADVTNSTFQAPFTFIRPGAATLRATASDDSDKAASSTGSVGVTVATAPFAVQFAGLPETMPLGSSTVITAQIVNQATKLPAADLAVKLRLGADSMCQTVASSTGSIVCSLSVTKNAALTGLTRELGIDIAGASAITSTGRDKTMIAGIDGLMSMTVSAATVADKLASAQPYGVLLRSYNPNWSGTGAHLDNASIMYTDSEGSQGKAFNIPSIKPTDDIVFYLDNILLRMKPLVLAAPARVTGGFFVTGANGQSPRIKGFCFVCWPIYDDAMPDINDIGIANGAFAVDLAVVDGHVTARLSSIDATLNFSCGGVAATFCPYLRAWVNDEVRQRLKTLPPLKSSIQQIGARLDAAIQQALPAGKIKTLTSLSFGADGSMTITGTPLAN
ncbi:hypothetical protein M9979_07135 [Sphingomonas sp. RP10(2022)]|uniref:Uncharacterized protein n=1 Tax=Sphingomonas liriopis TaxID=2949094 RepID=A0A9X2HW59_9SPHN|nr:hypothetical protein [Sphingomonas liriopis]MCP3734643.1 hypothetical protein [Sphingomonas liriopis]